MLVTLNLNNLILSFKLIWLKTDALVIWYVIEKGKRAILAKGGFEPGSSTSKLYTLYTLHHTSFSYFLYSNQILVGGVSANSF